MNLLDKVKNKKFFSGEVLEKIEGVREESFQNQDRRDFERRGRIIVEGIENIDKLDTDDFCEVLFYCGCLQHFQNGHDGYMRDWLYYYDDGEAVDSENLRPCAFCKKPFTDKCDGGKFVDPCLGVGQGVLNACCGHGVQDGSISFKESNEFTSVEIRAHGEVHVFRGKTQETIDIFNKIQKNQHPK